MSEQTAIAIPGLFNLRDVSGTGARPGVLFRSDAPASLDEAGVTRLNALVGTIVDLRSRAESERSPDAAGLPAPIRIPLLEGAVQTSAAQVPTLEELYLHLVDDQGEAFARIAGLVATAERGVLVHCTAGKDRTGVAVALLLDAVGVSRTSIIDDYVATGANLAGAWSDRMFSMIRQMGFTVTPAVEKVVAGTSADAMADALARVDEAGGSAAYLVANGLSEDALAGLRERLAG